MRILFFDTETTGLAKSKDKTVPVTDVENWPRVIELAWSLVNDFDEYELSHGDYLIKPDGWEVPKEEFWLSRDLTTDRLEAEGRPIRYVAELFLGDLQSADIIVAHNLKFDHKVLGAEMVRLGLKSEHKPLRICTGEASVQYCKVKFNPKQRHYPGQNYKFPKLEELWKTLFGPTLTQEHRAAGDVFVLRTCFFELVRRHVIKLPEIKTINTTAK